MNIDDLPDYILDAVASNMGWEDGEDLEPYYRRIAGMSPMDVTRRYAAWRLGDSAWADNIIAVYEHAQRVQGGNDE